MGTNIRAELSKNSKYYISKHRYLELKHFCLQYPEWKKEYSELEPRLHANQTDVEGHHISAGTTDQTADLAIKRAELTQKIELVEKAAHLADDELSNYILKGVTVDECSYVTLKMMMDIPCGKDMYYDRYHKFFYILSKVKEK